MESDFPNADSSSVWIGFQSGFWEKASTTGITNSEYISTARAISVDGFLWYFLILSFRFSYFHQKIDPQVPFGYRQIGFSVLFSRIFRVSHYIQS